MISSVGGRQGQVVGELDLRSGGPELEFASLPLNRFVLGCSPPRLLKGRLARTAFATPSPKTITAANGQKSYKPTRAATLLLINS